MNNFQNIEFRIKLKYECSMLSELKMLINASGSLYCDRVVVYTYGHPQIHYSIDRR